MTKTGVSLNLKDLEDKLITIALAQTDGNRTHAAKLLGVSQNTLRRRIAERESDLKEQE